MSQRSLFYSVWDITSIFKFSLGAFINMPIFPLLSFSPSACGRRRKRPRPNTEVSCFMMTT